MIKTQDFTIVHCPTRKQWTGSGETVARKLDGLLFWDCCGKTDHKVAGRTS